MICRQCAEAADRGLPAADHCSNPGCSCGHRAPTQTQEDDAC